MTFAEIVAVLKEQNAQWFKVRDGWQVWVFRPQGTSFEQRLLFADDANRWHVTAYWQPAGRLPAGVQDISTIEQEVGV